MQAVVHMSSSIPSHPMRRWLRAGLLTGLSDALFASALSVFFYDSTVARVWQGVASVLLGKDALNGGVRTEVIGLLMHFGVAFTWSAIFLFVLMRSESVRRILHSPNGTLKMAAIYGPLIWLVMSCVVIPAFLHRPPAITPRWWIQLAGHIPFVALPMITSLAGWNPRPEAVAGNPAAA